MTAVCCAPCRRLSGLVAFFLSFFSLSVLSALNPSTATRAQRKPARELWECFFGVVGICIFGSFSPSWASFHLPPSFLFVLFFFG